MTAKLIRKNAGTSLERRYKSLCVGFRCVLYLPFPLNDPRDYQPSLLESIPLCFVSRASEYRLNRFGKLDSLTELHSVRLRDRVEHNVLAAPAFLARFAKREVALQVHLFLAA